MRGNLLPRAAWDLFLAKLQAIPRTDLRGQRWMTRELAAAVSTELDKQGRILVFPQDQKAHAALSAGSVVVTGNLNSLKVWSQQRWAELQAARGIGGSRCIRIRVVPDLGAGGFRISRCA